MTLANKLQSNAYEVTGFITSSITSSFVFSEFLEKAVEVAVFAFITGMVGAAAAHLYRVIIEKIKQFRNTPKQ